MHQNSQQTKYCAVYTRKSTEEGLDQEFNSLDAQREACLAYIASQKIEGWKPVKEQYNDGGYSGGNMERPGLNKLISDIKDGKVDIVVVYKIDRLTRSLMDFARLVEVFDAHGVTFVSVTQSFNTTTSMGRLTLNVLLSFAQFEREVTGERIRDKIAASKKKGMWMGGCPPVGYKVEEQQLIPNKTEVKTTLHIFNRYLELKSVGALKRELEEDNIRSPIRTSQKGNKYGGATFSRGALYSILKNPIYIGKIKHKDKIYDGTHEAIIPLDIWECTQKLLQDQSTARSQTTKERHILQGLLYDCEGTLYSPTFTKKGVKQYRYYISQNLLQYKDHPNSVIARLPAHSIESSVEKLLRKNIERLCEGEHAEYVAEHQEHIPSYDLIRECLERATLSPDTLTLKVKTKPFKKLVEKHLRVSVTEADGSVEVTLPYKTRRENKGAILIEPEGLRDPLDMPADKLKKLVQGIIWREEHFKDGISLKAIAKRENCSDGHVRNAIVLGLNYL